ncbi:MAG: AMP-dependent synthetase/ligase [Alphaproteobacteria bacterium]
MAFQSLNKLFFDRAEQYDEKPFLWAKINKEWSSLSWKETSLKVREFAGGLKSFGIKPGDKVVIVSENRPEWIIADLAINLIGAVTVPAYTTNTEDDHHYILEHSDAKAVIASNNILANRVALATTRTKLCKILITLDNYSGFEPDNLKIINFNEVNDFGKNNIETALDHLDQIQSNDVSCIIYTSGTGGRPKGVMLTHRNIFSNLQGAEDLLEIIGKKDNKYLSLVPLSHSYEHTAGLYLQIDLGSQIYFCEGAEKFSQNLLEVSPTLTTAVPRIFEVIHDRIKIQMKNQNPIIKFIFDRAVKVGVKRHHYGLNLLENIEYRSYTSLIRNKINKQLGGSLRAFVSGGAALNPEIGDFFIGLGVKILQGYGQTEASPLISANRPENIKIETVGPAVKGVEAKLNEEGELIVKGDCVMKGYWKDEKATNETIIDGWLHTGDIATISEDGFITITGRKKELIVNSGGDNIAPARPEASLTFQETIFQSMVIGDRRPYLVAVIVPEVEKTNNMNDKEINEIISSEVKKANEGLSSIEKIRKFIIAKEPFSTENGLLTPTMKVRRHKVLEIYGETLDDLYGSKTH